MAPKLTIILTSRNKWGLLRFAVDSVVRQTFEDWELIVVDDASDDPRVREYLNEVENFPRVCVLRGNPVNDAYRKSHKMVAVRINAAIAMSQGEYISYLGDDNVYLPYRCENMVHVLDKNKKVGMVVDRVRWVMFDGQEADQDKFKFGYNEPYEAGHEKLLEMIAPTNYICTDSVMHRRQRPCCMNWPTDMRSHTPVDWRYWCYLVSELGTRVKKLNVVGERAYFPGTWRHGVTVKQVLSTRREPLREEDDMSGTTRRKARRKKEAREKKRNAKGKKEKIWCVNVSGKNIQITVPGGGAPIKVPPDGRVLLQHVKTSGGLMEGFTYDTRATTPPLKQVLATNPTSPKDVEYEKVEETIEKVEDEEASPPKPRKKRKPLPPPEAKKKLAKVAASSAKSPVDDPEKEEAGQDNDNIRVCACGKKLSPRNKSGKCRDCYIASLKKKK